MKIGIKELRILKILLKHGKCNTHNIAKLANMNVDVVNRLMLWLKLKGFVEYEEYEKIDYEKTNIFKEWKKYGIPERLLLENINEKLNLKDVKGKNIEIGIGWAKRKGLIKIINGVIEITKEGKRFLKEKSDIEKVVENGNLNNTDKNILKEMIERGAIKTVRKKEKIYFLTEKGENIVKKVKYTKLIEKLTPEIIKEGKWKDAEFVEYDVSMPVPKLIAGKPHPYMEFLNSIKEKLVELGFMEMCGPLIELEFWNFDALFQPQNHAARDWTSTYSLKNPKFGVLPSTELVEKVKTAHEHSWKYKWSKEIASKLMPRAHGTCLSARTLSKKPKEGKYFAIARCFRPDVMDSTHLLEFNQVEGIVIGKNLSFKNLLGILKRFAIEIANAKKIKFFPDYYPFTEPSVQISAYNEDFGWIEFGGAGIFREEMLEALGINEPVLAWGLGIDRIAMFKLGINDIRMLFSNNLEWLRNVKVI